MSTPPVLRGRLAAILEVGMLVALVAWLGGTYLSVRAQLDALPPGSQAYQFALFRSDDSLGLAATVGLIGVGLLAARRWWPRLGFVGVAAVVLLLHVRYPILVTSQAATILMVAIAAFWATLAAPRMLPTAVAALTVSAVATIPLYAVNRSLTEATRPGPALPDLSSFASTVEALLVTGAGLAAAALLRHSTGLTERLAASNAELVAQREAMARAAVVDERVRIARELHDVVAHHVATMTVHAGAARQVIGADPTAAAGSLRHIEQSGRDAVAELHRLLGFLRQGGDTADEDDSRAPTPSLQHLARLVASYPLEVTVAVSGDVESVPASLDVSIYRIIQEALTNVVKHSTAAEASVGVDVGPEIITVAVTDAGRPTGTGAGTGHGVLGVRERAALHGGTVEVGPDGDRGWSVRAYLPRDGRAA
ncbi:MAG: sensor histidine kinase [Acidimicrobiales bacterium]